MIPLLLLLALGAPAPMPKPLTSAEVRGHWLVEWDGSTVGSLWLEEDGTSSFVLDHAHAPGRREFFDGRWWIDKAGRLVVDEVNDRNGHRRTWAATVTKKGRHYEFDVRLDRRTVGLVILFMGEPR